jgi:transposase
MDNASFNKGEEARKLIETAGHTLLYIQPYSPDFNPIKGKWIHLDNVDTHIPHNHYTCNQFQQT